MKNNLMLMRLACRNKVLCMLCMYVVANKQLLDDLFGICGIIKVEVTVISRAEGETSLA